ncbi:hypothetical protein [Chitinimonas lacunae]|uniref:NodB homology domain-containing protein n=1 Tax=Chitinimonas lacunae TaxID=1963018 RepID=A0ABV8MLZ0_9NEIS
MLLALKIDVGSCLATRDGLPRLVEVLQRHGCGATFSLSLGQDRSGRAWLTGRDPAGRFGLQGFASRGWGNWLPAPEIGVRGFEVLRAAHNAGFEMILQGWDRYRWLRDIGQADQSRIASEYDTARRRFAQLFGAAPAAHAAPDCRAGRSLFRLDQRYGLSYASHCRGRHPFWPVVDGEPVRCPQLPVTLPSLLELLQSGAQPDAAAERLIHLSASPEPHGHVYNGDAAVDGGRYLAQFDRMLSGWRERGYKLVDLATLRRQLNLAVLPYHSIDVRPDGSRLPPQYWQGEAFPSL